MKGIALFVASLALTTFSANSWGDDDAEATIRLMGAAEAELPDAVTKEISLPEHLLQRAAEDQPAAVEHAQKGLDNANANREKQNRLDGLAKAEAARERGAEMSEKANENRENHGRSEDPPGRPDNPGKPDNPGQP